MSSLTESAMDAMRLLVDDLVAGAYAKVANDGRIGRLTVPELQRAIAEYGRTLVPLPDQAFDLADVYPIDRSPGEWAIDLPLWTKEEGRSDLTLSLTVKEHPMG